MIFLKLKRYTIKNKKQNITNKIKQKITSYLSKMIQEDKKNSFKVNNNINLNSKFNFVKNNSLNKELINLNNYNIENKNKIIQKKSNYFNSYIKTKQNKELIKIKTIAENLKTTPLNISKNLKQNFNYKINSKLKSIKNIINNLKNFNNDLNSYLKSKGLSSHFFNKKFSPNLDLKKELVIKQKKFNSIKPNILETKNLNSKIILQNKNKEKINKELIQTKKIIIKTESNNVFFNNIKTLLILLKIVKKIKDLEKHNSSINNLVKFSNMEINSNYINNINPINENNEANNSIIYFTKKFKNEENKKIKNILESKTYYLTKKKKINIQKNIRYYINSKTNFSSKLSKIFSITNNYNFNKFNQLNNFLRENIYEFLRNSFLSMSCLISKPVFVITPDKLIIKIFYFLFKKESIIKYTNTKTKSSFLNFKNSKKLQIICNILTRFLRKPIELELVRLYYPYYNSNILVNFIGMYINKIKLRKIVRKFIRKAVNNQSTKIIKFNNNSLPSELAGIKIKIAGRLLTQRVIPRKTVKVIKRGALANTKAMFVETARFTNKNKRGAFSITISIGHKLRVH